MDGKPTMRLLRTRRGSSFVEGALLFVVVVAALVAFFSTIRAVVAGRVKSGSDIFGRGMLTSERP